MKRIFVRAGGTIFLAMLVVAAGRAQMNSNPAQAPSQSPAGQSQSGQAPSGQMPPAGQAPATSAPGPEDPAESAAYKAFLAAHAPDPTAQIKLGEDFAKKYPSSRHLTSVYSALALDYLSQGDSDKMVAVAQKAIAIDPDNVDALSLTVWGMSRTVDPGDPNAASEFAMLENYGHHAIVLIATMPKPAGLDDAAFTAAKNDNLSMCHSGLGLIDLKLGKNDEAVIEMTQALALAATPDPVDYYLLGTAYETVGRYDDAVDTFTKCAAAGSMQDRCKAGIEDAKKQKLLAPVPPKS
jgi:tetratricopeptide (TPR) repeat protein